MKCVSVFYFEFTLPRHVPAIGRSMVLLDTYLDLTFLRCVF
jgi:hypothetical protein